MRGVVNAVLKMRRVKVPRLKNDATGTESAAFYSPPGERVKKFVNLLRNTVVDQKRPGNSSFH